MVEIGMGQVNNQVSKKTFRIIYMFSLIIAVLLIYSALRAPIKTDILGTHTKIEAIITNVRYVRRSANSEKQCVIDFKYIVESKEYVVTQATVDKIDAYEVGDKIYIYYNNSNIGEAYVYRVLYVLIIFGILLIVLFTLVLIKNEKRDK